MLQLIEFDEDGQRIRPRHPGLAGLRENKPWTACDYVGGPKIFCVFICVFGVLVILPGMFPMIKQIHCKIFDCSNNNTVTTPYQTNTVRPTTPNATNSVDRRKRSVNAGTRQARHILEITFEAGKTTTVLIDACTIATCTGQHVGYYSQLDKYICVTHRHKCGTVENQPRWRTGFPLSKRRQSQYAEESKDGDGKPLSQRLKVIRGNPPPNCKVGSCDPILLTLENAQIGDSGDFMLGIFQALGIFAREERLGKFRITITPQTVLNTEKVLNTGKTLNKSADGLVTYVHLQNVGEVIAIETGFEEKNMWLEWMLYTAKQAKMSGCVACASARPSLGTVPFPLTMNNDQAGFKCLLKMYFSKQPHNCTSLSLLFPIVKQAQYPPPFTPYPGKHSCISREDLKGVLVGKLASCHSTHSVNSLGLPGDLARMKHARTDIWWYCGAKTLYPILPKNWSGTCAPIQLVLPFYALPYTAEELMSSADGYKVRSFRRSKRSVPGGSFDRHVYLDAIGVPRGVPDEFKARCPVAAGFESIFIWPTVNKNVDWINYIYYNQQRFVNYTRDAIRGLMEQLEKTSLMTWQNRMALDMILAEKGGVCSMFGSLCCTYIPNNTSPDGSVTRALLGLTALSLELAEHSGVEDPFGGILDKWFGKWKALFLSLFMSLAVGIALLVLGGCCCIPCMRTLANRLITTALTKEREAGLYPLLSSGTPLVEIVIEDDDGDDDSFV